MRVEHLSKVSHATTQVPDNKRHVSLTPRILSSLLQLCVLHRA